MIRHVDVVILSSGLDNKLAVSEELLRTLAERAPMVTVFVEKTRNAIDLYKRKIMVPGSRVGILIHCDC